MIQDHQMAQQYELQAAAARLCLQPLMLLLASNLTFFTRHNGNVFDLLILATVLELRLLLFRRKTPNASNKFRTLSTE